MLTQEKLKKVLSYSQNTGEFYWLISHRGHRKGRLAGSVNEDGYCLIKIDGVGYPSHRLAWLYVYGYFPENYIDHINRNPSDNRIINLREATNQCNQRNSGNTATNTSGIRGVSFIQRVEMFAASIKINGKSIGLGAHKDILEAACLRLAAEQAEGWPGCNSSTPAFKYVSQNINRIGAKIVHKKVVK